VLTVKNIATGRQTTSLGQTMKIQNADSDLRQQLLALARKFEDAWNSNDAVALAALFTEDAVLVEQSGPV
jgi:hypothetical protein